MVVWVCFIALCMLFVFRLVVWKRNHRLPRQGFVPSFRASLVSSDVVPFPLSLEQAEQRKQPMVTVHALDPIKPPSAFVGPIMRETLALPCEGLLPGSPWCGLLGSRFHLSWMFCRFWLHNSPDLHVKALLLLSGIGTSKDTIEPPVRVFLSAFECCLLCRRTKGPAWSLTLVSAPAPPSTILTTSCNDNGNHDSNNDSNTNSNSITTSSTNAKNNSAGMWLLCLFPTRSLGPLNMRAP